MSIRKSIILISAVIGLALSTSQAVAVAVTGQVSFNVLVSVPDGQSVVVVNVSSDGIPKFCYAVSSGTAANSVTNATIAGFATILAAKKITGSSVTINCNDDNELTSVL
jgi:hypothetical protein